MFRALAQPPFAGIALAAAGLLMVTMGTYLATGIVTRDMLPLFAIVAPAMLVPTLLGTRMYIGISEARFRQIVLGLLTVSGVALLVSSVPQLLKA